MTSDDRLPNETLPLPSSPTTTLDYSRSVSQDLRDLDDALTHAIDQLTKFNSETMSDLSLKYELIRNNEVRSFSNVAPTDLVLFDFLEPRDRILRPTVDDSSSAKTAWTQWRISQ